MSMNLVDAIKKQRVKYIVSSYQLQGTDSHQFDDDLECLLSQYPTGLIELALVETLVENWVKVPLLRGEFFLIQVHQRLRDWQAFVSAHGVSIHGFCIQAAIASKVTPAQFQQITGLDPRPIFGDSTLIDCQT